MSPGVRTDLPGQKNRGQKIPGSVPIYNTRKVVTYDTLDSAKKLPLNLRLQNLIKIERILDLKFYAKGKSAEVVVYNTLDS